MDSDTSAAKPHKSSAGGMVVVAVTLIGAAFGVFLLLLALQKPHQSSPSPPRKSPSAKPDKWTIMNPGEIVTCKHSQTFGQLIECNLAGMPRADLSSSSDATSCEDSCASVSGKAGLYKNEYYAGANFYPDPAVSNNVRSSQLEPGGSCACIFEKQSDGVSLCVSDANGSAQQAQSPQGQGSILSSKCDNMAVYPGDTIDTSKVCSGGATDITIERCRAPQAASFCQDCNTACNKGVNKWCYRPDRLAPSGAGPSMVLSKFGGTVQFGCAKDCNSADLDKGTTHRCAGGYVIVHATGDGKGGYQFDCCTPSQGYDFTAVDSASCS